MLHPGWDLFSWLGAGSWELETRQCRPAAGASCGVPSQADDNLAHTLPWDAMQPSMRTDRRGLLSGVGSSDPDGREESGPHCPYETPQNLRLQRRVTMRSLCPRSRLEQCV